MSGIPHHLLNVADPKKRFSASDYKHLAELSLRYIVAKKKLPIVVGGTGFYIDTLTGKMVLPEVPPDTLLRKKLEKLDKEKLFLMLKKKDPRRAKTIDSKNKVRLVRALEIVEALGKVPQTANSSQLSAYSFIYIGVNPDKETLDKNFLLKFIQSGCNI